MILFTYLSLLKCSLSPFGCEGCMHARVRTHTRTHTHDCMVYTETHISTDPSLSSRATKWALKASQPITSHSLYPVLLLTPSLFSLSYTFTHTLTHTHTHTHTTLPFFFFFLSALSLLQHCPPSRGEEESYFRPKWKAVHLEFGFGLHLDAKRREKHSLSEESWLCACVCVSR